MTGFSGGIQDSRDASQFYGGVWEAMAPCSICGEAELSDVEVVGQIEDSEVGFRIEEDRRCKTRTWTEIL